VFASSSSVYGATKASTRREDFMPLPISPYAVAKLAGEGYCRSFAEVYGIETVSLRYFNVFGPRQDPLSHYSAVIPKFITAFLTGGRPTVFGDGEQSRDFTYVANVVDANLLAMDADGVSGEIYNIGGGERVTLNGLIDALQRRSGRRIEVHHEDPRPGDIRDSLADISRARSGLGYEPSVTFDDGLALTVSYYEARLAMDIDRSSPAGL
jgi:nucleoside-diphosphate-sugar epimerase